MMFEQRYPHIAWWVKEQGWIEIGHDDWSRHSFVRALDPGGLVWEGRKSYPTLDETLQAMDAGLADYMRGQHVFA